jgi:hypothetical protein
MDTEVLGYYENRTTYNNHFYGQVIAYCKIWCANAGFRMSERSCQLITPQLEIMNLSSLKLLSDNLEIQETG